MRYAVIIERGEENYGAYIPDLPGCVAVGDTVAEVERLIREATDLHVHGMREDGLPIPEPTTVLTYVEVVASREAEPVK